MGLNLGPKGQISRSLILKINIFCKRFSFLMITSVWGDGFVRKLLIWKFRSNLLLVHG